MAIGRLSTYEGLEKDLIYQIVRIGSQYLDSVLEESRNGLTPDVFEYKRSLLQFVKLFKEQAVTKLPASFFTMVNTIGVCLMIVAHEDLFKIRKFLQFWMEKIEIEVIDEEEYEYPKYILRSSLCNILCQLGEYGESFRMSNFNIKEISSDVRLVYPRLKLRKETKRIKQEFWSFQCSIRLNA